MTPREIKVYETMLARRRKRYAEDPEYRKSVNKKNIERHYNRSEEQKEKDRKRLADYMREKYRAMPIEERTAKGRESRAKRTPETIEKIRAYEKRRLSRRRGGQPDRCHITGDENITAHPNAPRGWLQSTIERAHILPRAHCTSKENDDPNNRIFMRADLHRLFDGGWFEVLENGMISWDEETPRSIKARYGASRVDLYNPEKHAYMKRRMEIVRGWRGR